MQFLTSLLVGIAVWVIKSQKEALETRLKSIEDKIAQVETTMHSNKEFIVGKILNIAPEKEVIENKLSNVVTDQNKQLYMFDLRIKELTVKLDKLTKDCTVDLINFKKLMVKFRDEINQLHAFAKEGINGSTEKGGGKESA